MHIWGTHKTGDRQTSDTHQTHTQTHRVVYRVAPQLKTADQELVSWLQENVIGPVVFDQVELSAYQELWDQARTITESQKKPLAK